ncbi:unnamed protein product, partial [Staurois parvus]
MLQVQSHLMGPYTALPLLLSPSPHSAMCHFQVSSHSCWFPFCHRLLYGLPLLLPPPPHCGSKHWFWPRDWPNEVKCAVILRSTALICMSY